MYEIVPNSVVQTCVDRQTDCHWNVSTSGLVHCALGIIEMTQASRPGCSMSLLLVVSFARVLTIDYLGDSIHLHGRYELTL